MKLNLINLKVSGFFFSKLDLKCDTSNLGVVFLIPELNWQFFGEEKPTFTVAVSEKFKSKQSFYFTFVLPSITIGSLWNADYSIFRIMLIIFSISFQSSLNLRPNHNMQKQLLLFSPINTSICYFPLFQFLK